MPGPPYIPHEKTPKKKENSVPDTRPVCVAPQSDPPSTCAGPVRRAVSGVPRVEPWLSSCRAVEAPSRHCRGAVEALCRGAVEALPVEPVELTVEFLSSLSTPRRNFSALGNIFPHFEFSPKKSRVRAILCDLCALYAVLHGAPYACGGASNRSTYR